MASSAGTTLTLSKHHGAGNDFLVAVDPEDQLDLTPSLVRALCDRRTGIGADGVIRVGAARAGAPVSMELVNADGGTAEMSGNGIRCLAQAAVAAGLVAPPRFCVATAAGVREVDFVEGDHPWRATASVDMGPVTLGGQATVEMIGWRGRLAEVGNPHLVLWGPDPAEVDIVGIGTELQGGYPGGINVEFIAPAEEPDTLVFRVFERGVGATLACGTGSVAAAAAARGWGLVGDRVRVENPGGMLEVELGPGEAPESRLAGPVIKVGDVTVDRSALG
jgi:diaminopimelate epimerase